LGDQPKFDPRSVNSIEEAVKALDTFISPHLRAGRRTPAYDKARIQELEKDSAKRLKTISWGNPIFCTGYAGTGKTLLGLQAALLRLEAESDRHPAVEAGLFVCFNKVLASDINRLTALSPKFRDIKFDTFDIFALLRFIAGRLRIDVSSNSNDADVWAKEILAEILKRKDEDEDTKKLFKSWDFIVVDEAQDLADWGWKLLDALSDFSNNLFVIDGKNQLLYRNARAEHLDEIYKLTHESQDKANFIEQRRVFRTTDTTFLISQLFMLTYPDLKAAERKWEEHLKPAHEKAKKMADKRDARQSPLFDFDIELSRGGGYAHKLVPLPPLSESEIIRHVTEYLKKGYEKVKEYYREDEPSNLLILVPFKNNPLRNDYRLLYDWSEIARTACLNLQLRYIDYSDEWQRRRAYAGDEVRICTFHSSRGIEGLHSIVLGFDSLAEAADDADWRIGNLAYITLSRSVYDTDILYIENTLSEREEIRFLKGIIEIVGK
jgi:hypothetical protein